MMRMSRPFRGRLKRLQKLRRRFLAAVRLGRAK